MRSTCSRCRFPRRRRRTSRRPRRPSPAIISRAQWGADESLRLTNCPEGPDYDANVNLAIVHHTGGNNKYGPADSPAIMRGLYAYATRTLQYCDMHYNFLVDRFGQIFEGRFGGITAPVHGAHSVGWNTNTTGIATIGNFQTTTPPAAMVASLERLIAWKFDVHGVDPTTPITYVTAGNDKFPPGTPVTVPRIIGHQDTWFTDCPGQYLEPLLPQIRAVVTALMAANRGWTSWETLGGSLQSAPGVGIVGDEPARRVRHRQRGLAGPQVVGRPGVVGRLGEPVQAGGRDQRRSDGGRRGVPNRVDVFVRPAAAARSAIDGGTAPGGAVGRTSAGS